VQPIANESKRTFNNWMELVKVASTENPEFSDDARLGE
jgi:hypothetical protein